MPRNRGRLILAAVIVAFWAAMTGLLIQREFLVPRAGNLEQPARPDAYDTWMGIYAQNPDGPKPIGFMHSEARPETRGEREGTAYGLTVKMDAVMLGVPAEIALTGAAWSPAGGGIETFDFSINSFGHELRVRGSVADERLTLNVETAGESFPLEFPVGRDFFLQGSMGTASLNLPYLEVGDEVIVDAFDPLTLSKGAARVKCVGTETLDLQGELVATRIFTTTLSNVTTKVWVTGDEEIVRIQTPFGIELRKLSREEALAALDTEGSVQLLDIMAVRPAGMKPFRGAKRMRVRLSGVPPTANIESGGMQQVLSGGELLIRQQDEPRAETRAEIDIGGYLDGDPFVQARHPRILAALDEIVSEPTGSWADARKIYEWVYSNILKTIVLSLPSALDVLDSREGDCNEHTVLYAALARSAGIPTRIAIGVVWSDELEGFYYHAWPEVHVGDWIAVDPTLGQPVADATHIKLLEGDVEDWPRLAPFLGTLRAEVLEIQ